MYRPSSHDSLATKKSILNNKSQKRWDVEELDISPEFGQIPAQNDLAEQRYNKLEDILKEFRKEFDLIRISTDALLSRIVKLEDNAFGSVQEALEFIPFFVDEDHASSNNITKLSGTNIEMTVEIIGFFSGTPVIYPFGREASPLKFVDQSLSLRFKDDEGISGMATVSLTTQDNICLMRIGKLSCNGGGWSFDLDRCTLPLTLSCDVKLAVE